MTSHNPPNGPYSVYLHRNGQVEVVYHNSSQVSHSTSTPRHPTTNILGTSPRSTAATFGSTNTRIASSIARHEAAPPSPRANHHLSESNHHRSSEPHKSGSTNATHHSTSPASGERHRHNSTTRLEKPSQPIPIPGSHSRSRSQSQNRGHTPSPQSSPQKRARFASLAVALPPPVVTSSGHLAPPSHSHQTYTPVASSPHRSPKLSSSTLDVPASRHRPSTSADSFFFLHGQARRPRGWYNRRGDHFVQKGVIQRQEKHLEWHPIFNDYPEPGTGWMDENGRFLPMSGGILKN